MRQLHADVVPRNTGRAFEVERGQLLKVSARTIVDLVAFNRDDLAERFDQGRTKANQGKIFVSAGDYLISRRNNDMFRITADTFAEGRHDLQYGMCSRARWAWAHRHETLTNAYFRERPMSLDDVPDHGCYENLSAVLAPYGIAPEDIPSPFNLFQTMDIDLDTGTIRHSPIRPTNGAYVLMEALMNLLVGISACPDVAVGGQDVAVTVLESR